MEGSGAALAQGGNCTVVRFDTHPKRRCLTCVRERDGAVSVCFGEDDI